MPLDRVFLNYRRDDSEGYVGRLYDHLNRRFPGRIFRDVTELRPGEDFVDALEREGLNCKVLLAVIGRHWLTVADASGNRRLDDPQDILRQEIVHALKRNILVIPVLVGGALMPAIEQLPADLARFGRRQALPISELDFDHDLDRLIRAISQAVGEPAAAAEPGSQSAGNEQSELMSRARSAIARQDWNAAIPALQSVLVLNPADAEAAGQLQFAARQRELANLFARGQALYERNDYPGALSCFQQVRALGGNYNDVDSLITLIQLGPPRPIAQAKPKRLRWIVAGVLATAAVFTIIGIVDQQQQPRTPAPIINGSDARTAIDQQNALDTPPTVSVQKARHTSAPVNLQNRSDAAAPVDLQANTAPAEPSTSHITLRYLGDQLGGCSLHINVNIGGRLLVPNSNPFYGSDVPEGTQHYAIGGAVVCPVGTCQAQGQGSVYVHEDSIFNIVWMQSSYSTCAMTLVPAEQ